MQVVIFGATGMVGQGVLRECLRDPQVTRVRSVARRPTGLSHPKLTELVRRAFFDWSDASDALRGHDACFFTLGVTSAGMSEPDYSRMTYDLTLAAATMLARLNPGMTFVYVSGAGTDATERGRMMWARVKGRTENALLTLAFERAHMFRPGMGARCSMWRARDTRTPSCNAPSPSSRACAHRSVIPMCASSPMGSSPSRSARLPRWTCTSPNRGGAEPVEPVPRRPATSALCRGRGGQRDACRTMRARP